MTDLFERIADLLARFPKASDVHVQTGKPVKYRVPGGLLPDGGGEVTAEALAALIDRIGPGQWRERLVQGGGHLDFSAELPGHRLRCNLFRFGGMGALALAARRLAERPPALESLGLPESAQRLTERSCGLVLVTGPTGSGKSTTLAAMVDRINRTRACHILTIEDPIEYLHRDDKATVAQREVGADTESFEAGLVAALREDPDVILLGEIRNRRTMETALAAAETGHLVLATLHTSSAVTTVERVCDFFREEEKILARSVLASVLAGVISQALVPCKDRSGRALACEVLLNTAPAAGLIREGKTHQLPNLMMTSRQDGMRLMNAHLEELTVRGVVAYEDAAAAAYDPAGLAQALRRRASA